MSKKIPLGDSDAFAIIDDEDFEKLGQYSWTLQINRHNTYCQASINARVILMHRMVLGIEDPEVEVNHKNDDGLDNRRSNLRIATRLDASRRKIKHKSYGGKPTSSKFKGVCWNKRIGKWASTGTINGKHIHLGYFIDEEDAAKAYNEFAEENYRDFARLNEVEVA